MITQEKWEAYVSVQHSGVTNMWAVPTVVDLSSGILDSEDCIEIMSDYGKYKEKYGTN